MFNLFGGSNQFNPFDGNGLFGGGQPPGGLGGGFGNGFQGGVSGGNPGSWPMGVPNPFGFPSPGQIGSTISGWFTNPYGNHGSVPNPSPWNGINPYGTQVSGGNTNPWPAPAISGQNGNTYDPGPGVFGQGAGAFTPQLAVRPGSTSYTDSNINATTLMPQRKPPDIKEVTQNRTWIGGIGTGPGPGGNRQQTRTGGGAWQTLAPNTPILNWPRAPGGLNSYG